MEEKYYIGIPEIDAQHEEISDLVASLRAVLGNPERRRLVDQSLKRLYQLLMTHFEFEESMMSMVRHQDLPQHKKMHGGVLKLFTDYFAHPPEPETYAGFVSLLAEKVLGHIMDHDVPMTAQIKSYLPTLQGTAKKGSAR